VSDTQLDCQPGSRPAPQSGASPSLDGVGGGA
jgi:hypothetical protein